MEYNFKNDLNPEQERYIKEMLYQKYAEQFKANGINSVEQMQICNMAEFLIALHPEKYARTAGDESNYRRDKNLKEIYAVTNKSADKEINKAVLINLAKDGKVPEGEFGVYDFNTHKFEASAEVKKEIIKYLGDKISAFSNEKQDEIVNELFNDLDSMDKLATMNLEDILKKKDAKVKEVIDKKIDETNKENGIDKEDREEIEANLKTNKEKTAEEKETDEIKKKSIVTPEMLKQAYALGYTQIKGAVQAKGGDAANKMGASRINANGGNVTILRFKDDSAGRETDRFLVFQGDRLVVPGTKDEEIDKLVGKQMYKSKDGALMEPLEIEDEEQYIKYDKNGMIIDIKLEEGKDLSVEDLEEYKRMFKENIEEYEIELYEIENAPFKSDAQKDKEYIEVNEKFNLKNADAAKKCDINFDDMKEINLITDERTQEQVDKEQDDPDEERQR